MKTSVKALIAGAVTAVAATVSTGASAQSLIELHEQHKAELSSFLHNLSVSIGIGTPAPVVVAPAPVYVAPPPVYAPAPAYVDPYGGHHGFRGPRGYDEGRRGFDEHARFDNGRPSPNQQYAQYKDGHFVGYISERDYARPNGN